MWCTLAALGSTLKLKRHAPDHPRARASEECGAARWRAGGKPAAGSARASRDPPHWAHSARHVRVLRAHAADGSLAAEEATLFQLDEYAGLGPEDERSYRAYLRRELAGIRFRTFRGLDGSAADPKSSAHDIKRCSTRRRSISWCSGLGATATSRSTSPARLLKPARDRCASTPPPARTRRRTSEDWRRSRARRPPSVCDAPPCAGAPLAGLGRGEGPGAEGDARGRSDARLSRVALTRPSEADNRCRPGRSIAAHAAAELVEQARSWWCWGTASLALAPNIGSPMNRAPGSIAQLTSVAPIRRVR